VKWPNAFYASIPPEMWEKIEKWEKSQRAGFHTSNDVLVGFLAQALGFVRK